MTDKTARLPQKVKGWRLTQVTQDVIGICWSRSPQHDLQENLLKVSTEVGLKVGYRVGYRVGYTTTLLPVLHTLP